VAFNLVSLIIQNATHVRVSLLFGLNLDRYSEWINSHRATGA
jgi:hypothetical protein